MSFHRRIFFDLIQSLILATDIARQQEFLSRFQVNVISVFTRHTIGVLPDAWLYVYMIICFIAVLPDDFVMK